MKKLYFLFLIYLFPALIIAQEIDEDIMLNKAVKGYIVFENQDTTWGRVKISTRANNQIKVNFLADSTHRWKTYKAKNEKVAAYGYVVRENVITPQIVNRWRHFKRRTVNQPPTPFSSSTVFMECKAAGEINLYSYYVLLPLYVETTYEHYYIIEQKFAVDAEEYRRRKITRDNFEKWIAAFSEDCKKVEELSALYSNFEKVIELYNECQMERVLGCCCHKCNCDEERERIKKLKEIHSKGKHVEEDEKFKTARKRTAKAEKVQSKDKTKH